MYAGSLLPSRQASFGGRFSYPENSMTYVHFSYSNSRQNRENEI